MEEDDDMIVVIIGDDENNDQVPAPMAIKQEVIDDRDEIEKIIEIAEEHGEVMNLDSVYIKQEPQDEYNLEENPEWNDDDDDYVPRDDEDDEEDDEDSVDRWEVNNPVKHRVRPLKPSQQKSFVRELREQYPELEEDTNALVTTLSEIMRNVKAPPPPKDFFIMNGIMFECVTCGGLSETIPAAGRHYQEKHGERYLVCFACGIDFRSKTNLYKHEKHCTAADAGVVLRARARMLGRKGRSRPYLPRTPPDMMPLKKPKKQKYHCSQCPASFVSKSYVQSHEMLHQGIRPYMCSMCSSAYTSLAALSRHRKKHSDEIYICDHCSRPFKIKTALVTHMNTHLPVKKFGCEQCGKRYASKAALVHHVDRRHLMLPLPCACQICPKRYPRMSVLKDHMKKAHGLILMTRKMFFKSLPTLTETQLDQAKVVMKSQVNRPIELPIKQEFEEVPECEDVEEVEVVQEVQETQEIHEIDDGQEQEVMLSEEVLQYLQTLQENCADGENYNVVVIEGGEVVNLHYSQDT